MASRKTGGSKEVNAVKVVGDDGEEKVLDHLYLVPETGVVLDKNDPNFDDLLEIEELKAQIVEARSDAGVKGQEAQAEVRQAQLAAEKARLAVELWLAQQAAKSAPSSNDNTVAQVQAQQAQAESQAEAAGKDN